MIELLKLAFAHHIYQLFVYLLIASAQIIQIRSTEALLTEPVLFLRAQQIVLILIAIAHLRHYLLTEFKKS
jgi:hypothetical protein